MSRKGRDRSLDILLELDGQILVVDPAGKYWVKFSVKKVERSPERQHGLRYSLTLHDETGDRLFGFDNAHPVQTSVGPGGKSRKVHDHKHRFHTVRPYEYKDAAALLADFWTAVDTILKEKGII
ncbi:MAG: DUF6516 family protein [Nitrospinaceae bacterium]